MTTAPEGADLRLVLGDKDALRGQPLDELAESPIYATAKEVRVPLLR